MHLRDESLSNLRLYLKVLWERRDRIHAPKIFGKRSLFTHQSSARNTHTKKQIGLY